MKFSGLTKKGRLYLAKIQAAEEPIQFTKIKFGDGKLSEHENPADLVDIKNIKVEKSILNKEQKEDAVILTTIIDNVGLVEGYFPRETGIYVQDEDQEVLYFYMNDGDETSWLPPEVDGPHKMEMKINLISSNTGSVLVHNDGKDLYITKDYLESNYTQKGNFNGTAQDIEDRVVAAVGKEDGKFPLTESVAGNIYYFPGNKKFYYCLKSQTSRVSVPNADFEELSIYQNRKKLENLFKIIEVDTSNFTIVIKYRNDTNTIINGYLLVKSNFRVGNDGSIYNFGNNLTLNGDFLTYMLGNSQNIYFYQPHKISIKNGVISSNIVAFSAYTTKVFYS